MKIKNNRVDHVHIFTQSKDGPVKLYTEMLGHQFCAAYDVGPTGNTVVANPTNELEVVVRPEDPAEIFRLCFVVDDLEKWREHFLQRGIRIYKEVNLPNLAHELQFDRRDTYGIAIQLGIWGPGVDKIIQHGLEQGRIDFPAPAQMPLDLISDKPDRFHCIVDDLDAAKDFLADLLCIEFGSPFDIPEWDARAIGSSVGLTLLMPLSDKSQLKHEIALRGTPHISRIGYRVANLDKAVAHFKSLGLRVERTLSRDGIKIAHFQPEDTYGIGFQLREATPDSEHSAEFML